jgi:hypothetical protein
MYICFFLVSRDVISASFRAISAYNCQQHNLRKDQKRNIPPGMKKPGKKPHRPLILQAAPALRTIFPIIEIDY